MIEVGTKLKSIRTGEVVEVLKRESGSMKVRLANGTEKVLSDSTVARWYDEVKDTKGAVEKPAKKTVKETVAKKEVKTVGKILKEVAKPKAKKENVNHIMAVELAEQLKSHAEKAGWSLIEKKQYTSIINKEEKHLALVWIQKAKIKFAFKKTNLLEKDKKWMVEIPKYFRASYTFQVNATDPTLMKRCLDLLDRING